MIYRLILPEWAQERFPHSKKVLEGEFTDEQIKDFNENQFYNIYYLPNYPSIYDSSKYVSGTDIDTFNFVYVDMDLKHGKYNCKDDFISIVRSSINPTIIVDSGNGVHVYWQVSDLDAMSFLKFQRRLMRLFQTDEAVGQIYQLLRVPGTLNTKNPDDLKKCETVYSSESIYTSEQLDQILPAISVEDLQYCEQHYNKTYKIGQEDLKIEDKIPVKFGELLQNNNEAKAIWSGDLDDRSKGDFRLGHIMFASGFTKEEAATVLVNSAKALQRAPIHRLSYATNIIDKIWTYEQTPQKDDLNLSFSVKEILDKHGSELKGTRFPCWNYIDATHHGFRLGQVIGLVAGSKVGKTTMALNMFKGFVQNNPDYDHFFIPLEQPSNEIAERWRIMCGDNTKLYDKVQILSNYGPNGEFRGLSLEEIKKYILKYQEVRKRKVGSVVIDHIGALKKKGKNGENQDIIDICHAMKAFAVETNTLLIMQSQAPREKAGIGDIELNKDAAYGTVFFESYCDYLITLWQPLKRVYYKGAPTVMAFKFCAIRHKKIHLDSIKEDVCYRLFFDPNTEIMRELTKDEETAFKHFETHAINARKSDKKTDAIPYQSINWTKDTIVNGKVVNNTH